MADVLVGSEHIDQSRTRIVGRIDFAGVAPRMGVWGEKAKEGERLRTFLGKLTAGQGNYRKLRNGAFPRLEPWNLEPLVKAPKQQGLRWIPLARLDLLFLGPDSSRNLKNRPSRFTRFPGRGWLGIARGPVAHGIGNGGEQKATKATGHLSRPGNTRSLRRPLILGYGKRF